MWIEGTWKEASPGEVCMVGCLASTPSPTPACDFLVSLYIPKAFSLKQRNMIVGFISSIGNDSGKALYPLSFEYPIQPGICLPPDLENQITYHYTKTHIAEFLWERENSTRMDDRIRGHLFKYLLKGAGRSRYSFEVLTRDLSVHSTIISSGVSSNAMMDLEIIAMEEYMGTDLSDSLMCFNFDHIQSRGKMYLVGCLDIRARAEILQSNSSNDVEDGLDCQIEVKLQ
ncbi:hypothetical protein SUGI_0607290 [Cryptomeria japonica]|nr:hypothetical protein SUGI_0607290 [Cryptomeria japonica]